MAKIDREEIMKQCMDQIHKKYASSTVGKYGELGKNLNIPRLTTTSISADWILGTDEASGTSGFARMSEILGYASSGKTTLALTAIAHLQQVKPDANIMFVDAEYALDPSYAASLGVDMSRLYIVQPDSSEEGYNIMEMFIQSGVADLVVLDSIAAMIPSAATEKEIGEEVKIASMARLTTQAIQRLNRLSAQYNVPIIFINQYKDAVAVSGIPGGSGTVMGNTNKFAPGGPSKDFYFQQIIEIKRAGVIKEKNDQGKEEIVCSVISMKTLKNKVGIPYRAGEFTIRYGHGLDHTQELVGLALSHEFIKASGAFYSFVDKDGNDLLDKSINGRAKVIDFLNNPENKAIYDKLEEAVKDRLFNSSTNEGWTVAKLDRGEDNNE